MRGVIPTLGLAAAAMLSGLTLLAATRPAEAGCTRMIVNKSRMTALVRRDDGPWVRIGPGRSQSIHYHRSGEIEIALKCGRRGKRWVWQDDSVDLSLDVVAVIDRCYLALGKGFAEEQLGPGVFGTEDTAPVTVNVPRQGDVIIGPFLRDACASH